MRKTGLLLALIVSALSMTLFDKVSRALHKPSLKNIALVVFLCLVVSSAGSMSLREAEAASRPNIIFILTDDMRKDDLGRMPQTRDLLAAKGTTFSNAFVPNSMCCPSRASILRGQYTHNHHVWGNSAPAGGFEKFHSEG